MCIAFLRAEEADYLTIHTVWADATGSRLTRRTSHWGIIALIAHDTRVFVLLVLVLSTVSSVPCLASIYEVGWRTYEIVLNMIFRTIIEVSPLLTPPNQPITNRTLNRSLLAGIHLHTTAS